jgi:hypothetical protein
MNTYEKKGEGAQSHMASKFEVAGRGVPVQSRLALMV